MDRVPTPGKYCSMISTRTNPMNKFFWNKLTRKWNEQEPNGIVTEFNRGVVLCLEGQEFLIEKGFRPECQNSGFLGYILGTLYTHVPGFAVLSELTPVRFSGSCFISDKQ